jgi:dimethylhistidine N-methyltransferase
MSAKVRPLHDLAPSPDSFLADVRRGLRFRPKQLPCKYFYDEAGSRLFEEICELDEYYLSRADLAIVRRHAAEMAGLLRPDCLLIEYGNGSSVKTRLILEHLQEPAGYVPIDIAGEQLRHSALVLARCLPELDILPVWADFTALTHVPADGKRPRRRVVYFAGSTIGNFTPEESVQLLKQTSRLVGPGGGLLLGADLKKDPAILHAAYNDRRGVTAAFNRNLLVRINRELGADFAPDQFWHHALYDPQEGRIEMHLVSRCDQKVGLAGDVFSVAEGETICTEYSYKYSLHDLEQLAATAGWRVERVWLDERKMFSVLYLEVK